MVPLEAPYPDVYTDTFIFFLQSLCKIIWMNVHYFPNAPRIWCSRWFYKSFIWGNALLYLRSLKGGCYSISDDLSWSCSQFSPVSLKVSYAIKISTRTVMSTCTIPSEFSMTTFFSGTWNQFGVLTAEVCMPNYLLNLKLCLWWLKHRDVVVPNPHNVVIGILSTIGLVFFSKV